MDLHNLHRPTPSAAQQPSQQSQPRVSAHNSDRIRELTNTHETPDLLQALEKARSHAAHWQKETERMDKIARAAMDKLEAKRAAKASLKADYVAARKNAETWHTRYNELCAAQKASASCDPHNRLAEKHARDELSKARQTIAAYEAEAPKIKERLLMGGEAYRKLQTIEPRLAASEKRAQDAESKLAAIQMQTQSLKNELTTMKVATSRQAELDATRIRQASSELATTNEKLRTATNNLSAKTSQVQATTDMLARTEQVLHTCSQLFAVQDPDHPLAQALTDSTTAVRQFLAKVQSNTQ